MKHEPPPRLDRTAVVDCAVRRLPRIDLELLQEPPKADARPFVANAHADRAVLIMDTESDYRSLEPWIGHTRHRQQQLAGEKGRCVAHAATMVRVPAPRNPLRNGSPQP